MPNEREIIERIRRAVPSRARGLRLGIGDDAAVLRPPRGRELVVGCDAFLENVHFLARVHPPEVVGYKSLARAASDLAAMGAAPHSFLLSLALPPTRTGKWLDGFLAGLSRAARKFGMGLAGGDTAAHRTVAISITVIGTVERGRAVTRSGARPGDLLYVSGTLGRAQLGLELVLRGLHQRAPFKPLLRPHYFPEPRLALGQWLAERRLATAMIDLSDGLSTDLARVCDASGVGAGIWQGTVSRVRLPQTVGVRGFDATRLALHGGEDYELLFTVKQRRRKQVPKIFHGVPVSWIGIITAQPGMRIAGQDGHFRTLVPRGWDHFGQEGKR